MAKKRTPLETQMSTSSLSGPHFEPAASSRNGESAAQGLVEGALAELNMKRLRNKHTTITRKAQKVAVVNL